METAFLDPTLILSHENDLRAIATTKLVLPILISPSVRTILKDRIIP